jgi:hypothetical protein
VILGTVRYRDRFGALHRTNFTFERDTLASADARKDIWNVMQGGYNDAD